MFVIEYFWIPLHLCVLLIVNLGNLMHLDSHQHLWKLERIDCSWMSSDYKAIFKDLMPADLMPLVKERNITQSIVLLAADKVAETEFTLNIVSNTEFLSGVVGVVDFEKTSVNDDIDRLSENSYLKGFRLVFHGISDDNWMIREGLKPGLFYLSDKGLTADVLVRPNHVSNLIIFAQTYNNLPIVIDHIAKPKIRKGEIDQCMSELAKLDNVYCKSSGTVAELGKGCAIPQITPYIDSILKIFDTKKLMWGSDWQVLTIVDNYEKWFDLAMKFCTKLSEDERLDIFSNTAKNFYRI